MGLLDKVKSFFGIKPKKKEKPKMEFIGIKPIPTTVKDETNLTTEIVDYGKEIEPPAFLKEIESEGERITVSSKDGTKGVVGRGFAELNIDEVGRQDARDMSRAIEEGIIDETPEEIKVFVNRYKQDIIDNSVPVEEVKATLPHPSETIEIVVGGEYDGQDSLFIQPEYPPASPALVKHAEEMIEAASQPEEDKPRYFIPFLLHAEMLRAAYKWSLVIFDKVNHKAYAVSYADLKQLQALLEADATLQATDTEEAKIRLHVANFLKTTPMGQNLRQPAEGRPWYAFTFVTKEHGYHIAKAVETFFKKREIPTKDWFAKFEVIQQKIRHCRVSTFQHDNNVYLNTLDEWFGEEKSHKGPKAGEVPYTADKLLSLMDAKINPSDILGKMGYKVEIKPKGVYVRINSTNAATIHAIQGEINRVSERLPGLPIFLVFELAE